MAAKADANTAELTALLARLNTQVSGAETPLLSPPGDERPAPADAMALYFVAARLVEVQLELLERGADPNELARQVAVTRDVLEGTRSVLKAALDGVETANGHHPRDGLAGPPALKVVNGGRGPVRRTERSDRD